MSCPRFLGAVLLALGTLAVGCQTRVEKTTAGVQPAPRSAAAPVATVAPVVLVAKRGTPVVNGELDQRVWHEAARTEPFVDAKKNDPVPHTEARASWDDEALYLELYVADDDLRASDHVRIELDGARSVEASPDGSLRCRFGGDSECSALGIHAGFDVDGDVDGNAEEDEEWGVTIALPWRTLAPEGRPAELRVSLARDDSSEGRPVREVWTRGGGIIRLE
jgi:hypothetical protein